MNAGHATVQDIVKIPALVRNTYPIAYAANLRLHLSHPLGKVKKKRKKGTAESAKQEQGIIQN